MNLKSESSWYFTLQVTDFKKVFIYNFQPRGQEVQKDRRKNFHFSTAFISTRRLSRCVNNIAFVGLLKVSSIHSSLDKCTFKIFSASMEINPVFGLKL